MAKNAANLKLKGGAGDDVVLGADAIATTENAASGAVNVLANDSVPDVIKTFTYTQPGHGTALLVSLNLTDPQTPAVAQFVYTPAAGYWDYLAAGQQASDAFTYT